MGISAHGILFVYRNPTTEQREEIDQKYGNVMWIKFGPSPDEGGATFLEEHFKVYCDDSKQTNFHTRSNIDASIEVFLKSRSWLKYKRLGFAMFDQANNYSTEIQQLNSTCRSLELVDLVPKERVEVKVIAKALLLRAVSLDGVTKRIALKVRRR